MHADVAARNCTFQREDVARYTKGNMRQTKQSWPSSTPPLKENREIARTPTPFGNLGRKTVVLGKDLIVPPFNIGPGATPNYERDLASRAIYDRRNQGVCR
jgi:hypothetical protein